MYWLVYYFVPIIFSKPVLYLVHLELLNYFFGLHKL